MSLHNCDSWCEEFEEESKENIFCKHRNNCKLFMKKSDEVSEGDKAWNLAPLNNTLKDIIKLLEKANEIKN